MNTKQSTHDSKRFEKGLSALLKHAQASVEASPAFRADLLERLKGRQSQLADARRRRHRILALCGSVSAAAAALFVALTIFHDAGVTHSVLPDAAVPTAGAVADAGVPAEAVARLPEDDMTDGLAVRGAVAVESQGAGRVFRTSADQSGAVEFAPGAWLVMQGACLVSLRDGQLDVEHGQMLVDVRPDADAARLAFANHTVDVPAGTRLTVQYKPAAHYAPGGRPAPLLTLMEGMAHLTHAEGRQELATGESYEIYPAVATAIRQRRAGSDAVLRDVNRVLVHYTGD